MVSHLCKVAGVSRSGYYNYFSVSSQEQRKQKSDRDEILKETILKALRFRNRNKGDCQIKMTLAGWSYPCQVDSNRLGAFSLSSLSSKFNRTKVV